MASSVDKETQSGPNDDDVSVELPAPPAWKNLVSLTLSLSLRAVSSAIYVLVYIYFLLLVFVFGFLA